MLARLIAANDPRIAFRMLVVGAGATAGGLERFEELLELFPSSTLSTVEIDPRLQDSDEPAKARGMRRYSQTLGARDERRTLYQARNVMYTSFYEPDERFADLYNTMDGMRTAQRIEVPTLGLDDFVQQNRLGKLDFIKIDAQGAELDILRGGRETLSSTVAAVCEVAFVQVYKGQPLYGEVAACLRESGFELHTFVGFAGRVMKPLSKQGVPHYPVQMLWSDAFFSRDLFGASELDNEQLLKLAIMLDIYESGDAALHLVRLYDARRGTKLGDRYLELMLMSGVWSETAEPAGGTP